MNVNITEKIKGGNTLVFQAKAQKARLQLKGSGTITAQVSIDYTMGGEPVWSDAIENTAAFSGGVAEVMLEGMLSDDYIKITATSRTEAIINE